MRKDAKEELEYLTFLAKTLPEKQKKKVFSSTTLEPFVKTLLSSCEKEKRGELKNRRVFKLALMLINETEKSAWDILPSSKEVAMFYDSPRGFDKSRIIRQASRLFNE